jgi:hypothetical protein
LITILFNINGGLLRDHGGGVSSTKSLRLTAYGLFHLQTTANQCLRGLQMKNPYSAISESGILLRSLAECNT